MRDLGQTIFTFLCVLLPGRLTLEAAIVDANWTTLSDAIGKVADSARAFDKLRASFASEPADVLKVLRSRLDPAEEQLLDGKCNDSKALQSRLQELQRRGSDLSKENETVQGTGHKSLQAPVEDVAADLEKLACDLERHLQRLRTVAAARMPQGCKSYRAVTEYRPVPRSCSGKKPLPQNEVQSIYKRLQELSAVAKQIADSEHLAISRRLGARLARLEIMPDGAAELHELSGDVDKALVRIKKLAENPQQFEPKAPDAGFAKIPANSEGEECTPAVLAAASKRFEAAERGFQGRTVKVMLPPEVANLQRIIHSLKVLRSSAQQELAKPEAVASTSPDQTACARYLAGVTQLEGDLSHFRAMAEQTKQQEQPKKGRMSAGAALPESRSQNRQPIPKLSGPRPSKPALNAQRFF